MPISDRDYVRGTHPPNCTCVDCTKKRLGKKQSIWNRAGKNFSFKRVVKTSLPEQAIAKGTKKHAFNWLLPTILIFSCSFIGLGIGLFIGTAIPLYLLLGFSLIFSIEKWLYFPLSTKKYKNIGKVYRLLLDLSILSLSGLIIWSGIKLFSQQYIHSPLPDSLVLLSELVSFIWMWRILSRNRWRWPSMKLTVFVLACITLVFAFAGVTPFSTYKDTLITKWDDYQTERAAQQAEIEAEEAAIAEAARQEQIEAEQAAIAEAARQEQLEAEQARIEAEEARIEAEEAARIANLRNPSWIELKKFLLEDDTDEMEYIYPIVVCADFANRLKENAEKEGWRCAIVRLDMVGYTDPFNYGIASDAGHACNAFETTDRGLVYIDCTGLPHSAYKPANCDKIVDVVVGDEFVPISIFPEAGWSDIWEDAGIVTGIDIYW
ncbi:hypothetical protein ACFLTB_01805 [Chloroflexota bacterium]